MMVAVDVELRVYIDLDDDGDFNDPDENVSAYVRSAQWFLGWREPYQDIADTPTATIVLDNSSKRWSPEVTGSLFASNQPIQKQVAIAARLGSINTWMWQGQISEIRVTPGEYTGDRSVVLICVGHKALIDNAEVTALPLQESKRADQIIFAIFNATAAPGAYLQTGAFIYPYAGDTFDNFTSGYEAIKQVVLADRGRYWYNRTNQAIFWNKTTVATTTTVDVEEMPYQALTYEYGRDIVNDVRVNCYPRALSPTNNETLWTRQGSFTIPPGDSRTLRASFNDGTGAKVAGRNLQTPNTGNGTLAFTGGNVSVTSFVPNATGVDITLTNTGAADATVTTLIVRGQKITALNVEQARSEDATSVSQFGRFIRTLDLKLLYSFDLAKDIADYEIYRRSKARGVVRTLTQIGTSTRIDYSVIIATIMSRITVTENQTGHTGTYWVIGEEHRWYAGQKWETVYYLEPADTTAFWLVEVPGRSELNHTTILGL